VIDDEKATLDRAAVLNAGGLAAIAALLAAAGCSGKKSGGAQSGTAQGADPSPAVSPSPMTNPMHMWAQVPVQKLNPITLASITTCTIVMCDSGSLPTPPKGAQPLLTLTSAPVSFTDADCTAPSNPTPVTQSIAIYIS